jgi:hypothetical protein
MTPQQMIQPFFLAMVLAFLGGCASMGQIQACNQLAYQQAPPVYDSRHAQMMMQCPFGMAPWAVHPHFQAGPPFPLHCNQLMVTEDLNHWARRAVFDACMKGASPTSVVIEPAGAAVPGVVLQPVPVAP